MHRLRVVVAMVLAAVLLAPAAPALASDGEPPGRLIFGQDYTLESGEVLYGDLVVFGGTVTFEEDSRVDGNVVVWGGNVEVRGTIRGDLVAFGGNIELLEEAVIHGDVASLGGQVERHEGAEVRGQEVTDLTFFSWRDGSFPMWVPFQGELGAQFTWLGLFTRAARFVLVVLLMAGLAGLVAVLWPQPAARVGRVCTRKPLSALGVGLLTLIVAIPVVIVLLITVCLGLAGAAAVGVAILFGWIGLAIVIGERVLPAMTSRPVSPFWSAALGAGLLAFITQLLDLIPCVGWMGSFLVYCVGLGAVVLTRFGTVDYPLMLPPAAQEILPLEDESTAEG